MKNIILFGDDHWFDLNPLTLTRPLAELRIGALTLREKWASYFDAHFSYITQEYLAEKYPIHIDEDNLLINSSYLPNLELVNEINKLQLNQAITCDHAMIAARVSSSQLHELDLDPESFDSLQIHELPIPLQEKTVHIHSLSDIVKYNVQETITDIELLTRSKTSQPLSSTNTIIGSHPVFISEGAKIECCIFNTEGGPIYIGKDTVIMEGSMLRGPIAIGDTNIVKMGAKLYGGTTSGPGCRLGGEIKNTVFIANSNKGHDGFVGDSVIGEWCNLGADTNTSNLKNNYLPVKLWSYRTKSFVDTGLQFCGLIMGDHSKCGINTMFNTGTVVGVSCNIFGDGFPRNYIPSFSWGGASGFVNYKVEKAIETAEIVIARRQTKMSDCDKKIFHHLYNEEKTK
jgi:UDP-N-acetylglucosamine diphosphorylase/glucosamine-1-phosphate N-acetyltransferase